MNTLIRGNRSGRLVTLDLTRTLMAVLAIALAAQALALLVQCDPAHRHPLVTFGRTTAPAAPVDDPSDDVSLSVSMSLSEAWQDALDPCAPIAEGKPVPGPGVKGKLFYWMKRRKQKQDAAANRDETQSVVEPPTPNNLQRNQALRMGIRF